MDVSIDASGRVTLVACTTTTAAATSAMTVATTTPVTVAAANGAAAMAAIKFSATGDSRSSTMVTTAVEKRCGTPALLLSLPEQCLLNVMQFLDRRDLCRTALTCQQFNKLRNNEILDQTRMQVLGLDEAIAILRFEGPGDYQALLDRFAGNNTMCYVHFSHKLGCAMIDQTWKYLYASQRVQRLFVGVTHVIVHEHPHVHQESPLASTMTAIFRMMPNIQRADVFSGDETPVVHGDIGSRGSRLRTLRCFQMYFASDTGWCHLCGHNLINLYLPQCVLMSGFHWNDVDADKLPDEQRAPQALFNTNGSGAEYPLLYVVASKLQRVDLKGCKLGARAFYNDEILVRPLSQATLVKFVRRNAQESLRWFSSDLTAENIALLQAEFPHITFV